MKITILANRDLASCIALNRLFPLLKDHELCIFLSAKVGKSDTLPQALLDLNFYEQRLFNNIVFPLATALGIDSAALKTFDAIGKDIGREILELNAINSSDFEQFKSTQPDLVLCIRYGGILREAVIAVPRFGVLNLHSGLLPQYKGVMATFRAMLNGDDEIGMTLHTIDDGGIDTGRIIGTTLMAVKPGRSYLWHVLALYIDGCDMMSAAVRKIAGSGVPVSEPQVQAGNYYSFPTDTELAAFADMGFKLTDSSELVKIAKQFIMGSGLAY